MQCEMCGRFKEESTKAIVEGAVLTVCKECAKYGNLIEIKKHQVKEEPSSQAMLPLRKQELPPDLREDYSSCIKKAREQKHLTQEQLANAIAEKEATIHKLETGYLVPTVTLAKKLEQFLRISLNPVPEKKPQTQKSAVNFKDKNVTIGDLLNVKKYERNEK